MKVLGLSNTNPSNVPSHSSLQYELKIIIERGLNSYPILKPLETLNKKALDKTILEIEAHTAKAPFLALIPLFLFQMPSLMLIFLYPIINEFLKEMNWCLYINLLYAFLS